MTIGGAITLIVIGLILVLGVIEVDLPYVNEYALGVILILAGIAGLLFALTWSRRAGFARGGTTRVVERRVVDEPPAPRVVERHIERDVDGPPPPV